MDVNELEQRLAHLSGVAARQLAAISDGIERIEKYVGGLEGTSHSASDGD